METKPVLDQDQVVEILRSEKGDATLDEFAAKLGIPRQKLWNILNKKQLPDESVGFVAEKFYTFRRIGRRR